MTNLLHSIPCPACFGVGCDGKSRECEACDGSGCIFIGMPAGVTVTDILPARESSRSKWQIQ